MKTKEEKLAAFGRILDIMDELRLKCPWDREQTSESLRPQTIEEVYELSDAILKNDGKNVSKELGDVLLHVIFYSKIGEEKGQFDIADVINLLCDKLIYRHPHVFSTVQVENSAQVMQNWEMLKAKEKDGNRRILSGVPDALPPLLKAYRMQDKARGVGFDWEKKEDVWDKVKEELGEYQAELDSMEKAGTEEERKALIDDIAARRPDVVFVAMGSPKQEYLMEEMSKRHPAIYQGLGGSFDVYVGKVRRAPKWISEHGLEGVYRAFWEPRKRLKGVLSDVWFLIALYLGKY